MNLHPGGGFPVKQISIDTKFIRLLANSLYEQKHDIPYISQNSFSKNNSVVQSYIPAH